MSGDYIVQNVAIHLVDPLLDGPCLSAQEIRLDGFRQPRDQEVLDRFFSTHLDTIWKAEEGRLTQAANFQPQSAVQDLLEQMRKDKRSFFHCSCRLAQLLYDASKGKPVSQGILLVVWFIKPGTNRNFLALIKMEPGPNNKVTLRSSPAGDVLLDLAVQHIENALPDTGDRVLKWAVLPHPTRASYQAKVKDEQGGREIAQYFMNFLGCAPCSSEKEQIRQLVKVIPVYLQSSKTKLEPGAAAEMLFDVLSKGDGITTETVAAAIDRLDLVEGFEKESFRQMLQENQAADLQANSAALRTLKVEYQLDNGVSIKGLRTAESSITIVETPDGGIEFRIRTTGYKRKYV